MTEISETLREIAAKSQEYEVRKGELKDPMRKISEDLRQKQQDMKTEVVRENISLIFENFFVFHRKVFFSFFFHSFFLFFAGGGQRFGEKHQGSKAGD
jgi:hypothetical protein